MIAGGMNETRVPGLELVKTRNIKNAVDSNLGSFVSLW